VFSFGKDTTLTPCLIYGVQSKSRMRMSHIYQPVMLMTLLQRGGESSVSDIAKAILSHDESQVEYYENVTKNMVGRVLASHEIVEKDKQGYHLVGYEKFTDDQKRELIEMCRQKLETYVQQRGDAIWQHRKKSSGYISGTLRYEVLKRAKFHCELCGISADLRALEVDHILPRNRGGEDDISNLQALCYSCNSMKRDRDDTDFREVREAYEKREAGCPFCEIPMGRIIDENPLAYAIRDGYPVTPLHTLIIPKRHTPSYFELGRAEVNACSLLLERAREEVGRGDEAVEGFNVGINDGEVAGQSVFHCHIHLIPRRKGDVERPRGGVRHVIARKGNY
jgi:ATP adenylyltransferase